jgi:catechol 2,3-dioxygenase-like lactoylglutathione lyase family enzyme
MMNESAVEGIGGFFLGSRDPAALANWYHRYLGIVFREHPEQDSYYIVFRTRDVQTAEIRESPVFAIIPNEESLAAPGERGFTLNLRVTDLDRTLEDLERRGITEDDERVVWEGGKHGWIRDLDGNRIELYEELPLAPDSPYRTTCPTV